MCALCFIDSSHTLNYTPHHHTHQSLKFANTSFDILLYIEFTGTVFCIVKQFIHKIFELFEECRNIADHCDKFHTHVFFIFGLLITSSTFTIPSLLFTLVFYLFNLVRRSVQLRIKSMFFVDAVLLSKSMRTIE